MISGRWLAPDLSLIGRDSQSLLGAVSEAPPPQEQSNTLGRDFRIPALTASDVLSDAAPIDDEPAESKQAEASSLEMLKRRGIHPVILLVFHGPLDRQAVKPHNVTGFRIASGQPRHDSKKRRIGQLEGTE